MDWWKKTNNIPMTNKQFQSIVKGFVFECPCCTRHTKTIGIGAGGEKRKQLTYVPVSARAESFKNRGITGHLLTTILAQIRKPLARNNAYAALQPSEDIILAADRLIFTSSHSDTMFELMVFHKRTDMPDAEAIYYYIRNAFAHGSFEVIDRGVDTVYLIESSKEGKPKARMRINEKTLLRYLELKNMTSSDIKALQRKRK